MSGRADLLDRLPRLAAGVFQRLHLWPRPAELRPPVIDHDSGDEQPAAFRVRYYSALGGAPRVCRVCWSVTCWTDVWASGDWTRCRVCHVELGQRFVPATFEAPPGRAVKVAAKLPAGDRGREDGA